MGNKIYLGNHDIIAKTPKKQVTPDSKKIKKKKI